LAEGWQQGKWIGQIRLCEELLDCPPREEAELLAMSADALRELAHQLRAELLNRS
jgi:hypothetical protein